MQFHEVRFPSSISFGSAGGPERRTEIVTLANGFEERNTPWAHARRSYDAGLGLRSLEDIETLVGFFEARQGQLYGFRWKDWSDFKSCPASRDITDQDQLIAIGDEQTSVWQLTKTYRSGAFNYIRPINKPVPGSVRISVGGDPMREGVDFKIDFSSGLVSFSSAPDLSAEVRAGFEFDVPVRFATDRIMTSMASFQAGEVPDVPIVEIRV